MSTTLAWLREIVAAKLQLEPEDVPIDRPVQREVGLDSVDLISLLAQVQETFPHISILDLPEAGDFTLEAFAEMIDSASA